MSTLVRRARISEQEKEIGKNAAIIVAELKTRFFKLLPTMLSLIHELDYTVCIHFEPGWFDTRFPQEIKGDSMVAACDEFEHWFEELFGIKVIADINYVGWDDPYTAVFRCDIKLSPTRFAWLTRKYYPVRFAWPVKRY